MPIVIQDLSYEYNPGTPFAKTALSHVNLRIEDGEFFGVIGHTGSGKSTLFAHLNALTRIQSGVIEVDEFKLVGNGGKKQKGKKPDYKALRARVGMVFQYPEYQLFAESVQEDVAFGPKNIGIKGEELEERVRTAVNAVGLRYDELKDRSPFDLSGGQKRRVAIAGVLAMRPKVLVLDEPTAGLEPRGKKEILDLIVSIKESMCPTVIMISHNMDEVAKYCSRIAVLSDGKLALTATPAELFGNADLLNELHIEMPSVTRLACMLADAGLPVRRDVLTQEDLIAEIARAKGVV